ncbi:8316_t:CDS:1 [Gigaspora rosea]|nr:8316_t:CDS:1 [Gigaspora rosea]
MDINTKREVENFISHLKNPVIFPGIFQLDINSYIRVLQQKINIKQINRKPFTAYDLLKKRITEEGRLINVTNANVISQSTNIIWRKMSSTQKSVFDNYAKQIRSSIRN